MAEQSIQTFLQTGKHRGRGVFARNERGSILRQTRRLLWLRHK